MASKPASRASANRSAYEPSFGSIEMSVDLRIAAGRLCRRLPGCAPAAGWSRQPCAVTGQQLQERATIAHRALHDMLDAADVPLY